MGKTIRRKNFNDIWLWYKTEEEFLAAKESCFEDFSDYYEFKARRDAVMDDMKKEVDIRRIRGENIYLSDVMRERNLYIWDHPDYQTYRSMEHFVREVGSPDVSYKEYIKKKKAVMHSDAGYGYWGVTAPRWYRNRCYERPMRRKVKNQLKKAVEFDTFDETVYDDCYKGAAYTYF